MFARILLFKALKGKSRRTAEGPSSRFRQTSMALPKPPCLSPSRVTISPMSFPKNWAWLPLLFLLLNLSAISLSFSSSSFPPQISYSRYCNSIVPESTPNDLELEVGTSFPRFSEGYFTGGQKILPENPESPFTIPRSVRLRTKTLTTTNTEGVLRIEASLNFRGGSVYGVYGGNRTIDGVMHLSRFHPRTPRVFPQRGRVTFDLRGFWSESSGKICLVGTGSGYSKEGKHLHLSAMVKLNYPKNATIRTNLVTGTVESLDRVDNVNQFDKISILGFSGSRYEYTLTSESEKECSVSDTVGNENSLNLGKSSCSELESLFSGFKLEYPFAGSLPRFMSFSSFECSDKRRLHLNLGFYNSSSFAYNYHPLVAQTTWVSEGIWDGEKNQLCLVACPIMNSTNSFTNASVGDCTIGLNIRIPGVFSIRERSAAVGTIWSNKKKDDLGFFERTAFRSLNKRVRAIPGLKYKYTQMDRVKKSCEKKVRKTRGKRYPDGHSSGDMRFDLSVKNTRGQIVWGYMNPLTIDDKFYADTITSAVSVDVLSTDTSTPLDNEEQNTIVSEPAVSILKPNQSLMNVSYMIGFTLSPNFKWGGLYSRDVPSSSHTPIDISAEGVYDAENGTLCMVGCRDLGSYNHYSTPMDCEILINVMLSPLNPKAGDNLKGTIKSSRKRKDPFYFEPLELFSTVISSEQIIERMDLEITMVLISLTLACVFIGLQLFYVKKNSDVLPSASLLMLVVLTLGYMMPLVLNFEAFFKNTNRQNVSLWSGGWLEGNEVVVRVVTMVAFLLQFRLLQLAWSSRLADGSKRDLWVAEKTTVYLCLPLYLAGGLIAGFVHWKTYKTSVSKFHHLFAEAGHSIWEDLRSYCGLVLDGFLFPQILLNLFLNLNVKALASSFYVGTTIVRLLPHAYDAYRSHRYATRFNASYIYANPNGDLYSNAWDAIIPCGGVIFVVIIYLQQRYGGACILPRRFRRSIEYEKVPVVSG